MMPSSSSHTTKIDDDTISTLFIPKRDANAVEVGKQGVQLKHFERVVKKLLTTTADTRNDNDDPHGQQTPRPLITINYTNLPLPPTPEWPFDQLPSEARVYGTQRGQLPNIVRAQRKEDQLRCMLACVMALLENCGILSSYTSQSSPTTIVDFGGGSGHLAIPLALLLPHCRIVVVDLSERALDLLHEKAQHIPRAHHSQQTANEEPHSLKDPLISHSQIKTCSTIPNLYTFHGPVEAYNDEFPVDCASSLWSSNGCSASEMCGCKRASNGHVSLLRGKAQSHEAKSLRVASDWTKSGHCTIPSILTICANFDSRIHRLERLGQGC